MTVLITLTTAGSDTGPFNLYSDVNNYAYAFVLNVTKQQLTEGYPSDSVPDGTTIVKVQSVNSSCNNFTLLNVPTTNTTTSSTSTSTSTTTTTTTIGITNYMTGVVINDSEDSGKTFYGPSYNFTSNTVAGDWNYQSGVMTIEQPSKFETFDLLPGNPASPSDNDIMMMHQYLHNFLPNDILFDPTLGNKMWYLISSVQYASEQLVTILDNATLIPDLQLIVGSPSKWEGTFLFDINLTQSNYVYLIWDYRKTITTTTTTAIPTTTTTTTVCVNRPVGLTNGNLILAVNNSGDPSRYFANVSVQYACETFNYFRAVPYTSGTGTSYQGMQYSSLTIGQKIYVGNDGTNCSLTPTGYYWFQPNIINPGEYFKDINQISIVTIVNGVIIAIDVCSYISSTTTTTTSGPYPSPVVNYLTAIILNDSDDAGKTPGEPGYWFSSKTTPSYWVYPNMTPMTIAQPSYFYTFDLAVGSIAAPLVGDTVTMKADAFDPATGNILFNASIGNKYWYLISQVQYTSAQLSTILANATLIQNTQLVANRWLGTFLFNTSNTQSNYIYMIYDYRKTN